MPSDGQLAVLNYDPDKYGFAVWARDALKVSDLAFLHTRKDLIDKPIFDAMAICRNELSSASSQLESSLRGFFVDVIAPEFGVLHGNFQTPPMFRVHLPGCPSVSALHRDRDYGMPSGRLNVWIPLTESHGNNSIWVTDDCEGQNLHPVNLTVGQVLIFDSANLLHGSFLNDTGRTRLSIDSRFTPLRTLRHPE
jgi:hypothetical protein